MVHRLRRQVPSSTSPVDLRLRRDTKRFSSSQPKMELSQHGTVGRVPWSRFPAPVARYTRELRSRSSTGSLSCTPPTSRMARWRFSTPDLVANLLRQVSWFLTYHVDTPPLGSRMSVETWWSPMRI